MTEMVSLPKVSGYEKWIKLLSVTLVAGQHHQLLAETCDDGNK